ncbi:MAG: hypothetical protein Q9192_005542, partial [Flavoplaca navasiana]
MILGEYRAQQRCDYPEDYGSSGPRQENRPMPDSGISITTLENYRSCSPSSESLDWRDRNEVERVVKMDRIGSTGSLRLRKLKIWLQSFGVEIYPAPEGSKNESNQDRRVGIAKAKR